MLTHLIFDAESSGIARYVEDRELKHLFTPTRVTVKKDLPKLDIGSVHLEELHENSILEVPRWVAGVLSELGLAEVQEESYDTELFKALSRERIQPPHQPSTLKSDFYIGVKRHQDALENKDKKDESYERNSRSLYDLVTLRIGKLLGLASSPMPSPQVMEKLTPEEAKLYESVNSLVREWRKAVLQVDE